MPSSSRKWQNVQSAEDLLAEEKERLAVTLRSIDEGVITTDISGRVLLVNRVAERLTGTETGICSGFPDRSGALLNR